MLHCKDFEGFNFAENIIKLLLNKTKWTGLLATTRAFTL